MNNKTRVVDKDINGDLVNIEEMAVVTRDIDDNLAVPSKGSTAVEVLISSKIRTKKLAEIREGE